MKIVKAKPKNSIVSAAKPMPSITEKIDDGQHSFRGPGLNTPKQPKDYSKKGK